ncbi:unnamed protein product [Pipistrellus nathusii]|uniref:Uncharacterized protein n=1 Tax=Pipistrellus nathusii TaxID=59473 RepID=A0ABN9ZF40_PIPNA
MGLYQDQRQSWHSRVGSLTLRPVLFPASPKHRSVDLTHTGSTEPLCTSHPTSTFSGIMLVSGHQQWGMYTTSANTTNQGSFGERAGPLEQQSSTFRTHIPPVVWLATTALEHHWAGRTKAPDCSGHYLNIVGTHSPEDPLT